MKKYAIIVRKHPKMTYGSVEEMKTQIDTLFQSIEVARFPPNGQKCRVDVVFWLSGLPMEWQMMARVSKNQEVIDYFDMKCVEMIKILSDADNGENAKICRPLLKELESLV